MSVLNTVSMICEPIGKTLFRSDLLSLTLIRVKVPLTSLEPLSYRGEGRGVSLTSMVIAEPTKPIPETVRLLLVVSIALIEGRSVPWIELVSAL